MLLFIRKVVWSGESIASMYTGWVVQRVVFKQAACEGVQWSCSQKVNDGADISVYKYTQDVWFI